jgi:uncharacterized protein YggE
MNNAKTLFWILLNLLIAVAIVNVVFFVMPLLQRVSNGFYPARTISVSAEGKATVSPDLAEVSFSVVSQGQNPETLTTANNDKMNAVIQFVKGQSIDEKDIKTTDYNLSPTYQYDKNTQRNYITGYTLTQTVQVKVRDLSKVASVVGGLAPLGVNQIGGINFTFDDPEKFLAQARADAFTKVAAKAQEMAAGAGVSLGRVLNVTEYGTPPGPRPYYSFADKASAGGVASAPSAPDIQPGTQDVTDQVTVTYELR